MYKYMSHYMLRLAIQYFNDHYIIRVTVTLYIGSILRSAVNEKNKHVYIFCM